MKKMSLLALLLVACMLLSGCALITVDEKADNAQIIVDVNGETITKGMVNNAVDYQIQENEQMNTYYSYFGMSAGLPTDRQTLIPQVIDSYVKTLVSQQKAKELGMDQMTAEDTASIEAAAQEEYDAIIDQVIAYNFSDEELTDEEAHQKAIDFAAENGVDLAFYVEEQTQSKALEKLRADTIKDVEVTEEELVQLLNEKAESAKTSYESSLSSYGYAINNGTTVYYAPAGYRMVKQILVKFAEEDAAAITEAQSALTAAQTALNNAAEDADQAALEADVAAAQAKVDEATENAKKNIQDKVNEVYEKAAAEGADFDALVKEYNEDEGMPENGYAVCEGYSFFVESFTDAAMALDHIGAVSEPTLSEYGYHILQYSADIEEGTVALDTVRETLSAEKLSAKQTECFNNALAAWIEEAQVKTYAEKMN